MVTRISERHKKNNAIMRSTGLIMLGAVLSLLFIAVPVHAQGGGLLGGSGSGDDDVTITKDDLNLPGAKDNIGGNDVQNLLNIAYLVAGFTAVIVIIIGGVRYATSQGDSNGIQQGKNTVLYAVVGLVVVLAAAAITNFILQNVTTQ